uniref:AAA+ ATPase domain-containing protein n=1 Tax=Ananas comosus var. bracteatus TaxID=296719 RepID=A0A6V7PIB0_ANACO|nr:unnamed protein product [Ananas comosus var. bracteatus]
MACSTSHHLLSSATTTTTLYGSQLNPRPRTNPLLLLPRRPRSAKSCLLPPRNPKPISQDHPSAGKNLTFGSAVATFLLTHGALLAPAMAEDSAPAPAPALEQSPPAQFEAAAKEPSASQANPFAQALLTAPKPQSSSSSSDLPEGSQWRYSEFLSAVRRGKVERVRFSKDGSTLQLTAVDGRRAAVVVPNDPDLIDILAMNGVDISVSEGDSGNGLFNLIGNLLFPFLAFAGLFFLFRRAQGGPGAGPGGLGGPMDFGRSKSKFQEVPDTGVTFADVAGADQAKLELQEVVDFLKNPDKYTALGAKIPKGCLLVGPPAPARPCSPAPSPARPASPSSPAPPPNSSSSSSASAPPASGTSSRRPSPRPPASSSSTRSTLGVIVLAATNRPDVLDSALLRPGRFDRQVTVDRPDVAGRVKILQVHSRGKALAKDVDFEKIARRTPGFTGADLQNLMNEAAILAARRDLKEISKDEISDALERIIAGPEKKNAVVSEEKKKLVAYHEAGHALVGALMPEYDPVAKISIIPRGQAGGLTFFAPSEERLESGLYSRSYLENQMAVALGGRVAEEVIFGEENVTTGASNDFMQVSRVARQMVERFGFSKKIGQIAIGGPGGNPFLGQQMSPQKDYSMATADVVDAEVRDLVEKAYSRAKHIINTHIDILHKLAQLLIEKETVDGEEFMSLFIDGQAELFVG